MYNLLNLCSIAGLCLWPTRPTGDGATIVATSLQAQPQLVTHCWAMEYSNSILYSLTANGVMAHRYTQSPEPGKPFDWLDPGPLDLVAQQTDKKNRTPQSIAVLDKVFVVYKSSTSTFNADLSPTQGLNMRDVSLIEVGNSLIAAITPQTVHILEVSKNTLRMRKSVDLSGILCAKVLGASLLVATSELYELVDFTLESRIPLFPSPESPIVCAIPPHEFLITQGNLGLSVKFTGEASRQPINWDQPPNSIAVEGQTVLAIVGDKLVLHSLETSVQINEIELTYIWPHESTPKLKNTGPMVLQTLETEAKLGHTSTVVSHTVLYSGNETLWFVPPSGLDSLQQAIWEGQRVDLPEDELQAQYLKSLQALVQLRTKPQKALENHAWEPELVLHIFGDGAMPTIFPGLVPIVEEMATMTKTEDHMRFYKQFLAPLDYDEIYVKLLTGTELVDFLLEKPALLESQPPAVLEEYYTRKKDTRALLELWHASPTKANLKKITEALSTSTDTDFVWTEALRLIAIDPKLGVTVFTRKTKVKFDPDKVLAQLEKSDGDVAWRSYLRYLVYNKKKKVFAQNLVMLVVDDLIEKVKTPQISELVEKSYSEYQQLKWPKRPYLHFLQGWSAQFEEFAAFVELETEFASLVKDGSDMAPVIAIIDEHAPELYVERCAVYRKLGLHNQCIDFLVKSITDYMAAIWYCLYDSKGKLLDDETRYVLAKHTFKVMVDNSAPSPVIIEHLEKQKSILSLDDVLSSVPESTPMGPLSDFVAWHLEQQSNKQKMAQLARSLTRGEDKWCDKLKDRS